MKTDWARSLTAQKKAPQVLQKVIIYKIENLAGRKLKKRLVSMETKCCCSWRGPQRKTCKTTLLGKRSCCDQVQHFSRKVPDLLHWSLHHSQAQHLVDKHKRTSRESVWKKTTTLKSQWGCPMLIFTCCVKIPISFSQRFLLTALWFWRCSWDCDLSA